MKAKTLLLLVFVVLSFSLSVASRLRVEDRDILGKDKRVDESDHRRSISDFRRGHEHHDDDSDHSRHEHDSIGSDDDSIRRRIMSDPETDDSSSNNDEDRKLSEMNHGYGYH